MKNKSGFTLVEIVAVIFILTLIGIGLASFSFWGYRLWHITQDQIHAQDEARAAFKNIVGEIREMQISDNGSYALDTVQPNTIIFYANVDSDTKREKVKYELVDGTLIRWYEKSDASVPPAYPAFTEANKIIVAQNILNTDIFQYYDDTFNGSTPPLPQPVQLNDVRLVKIHLSIDYDPERTPAPLELETNIALRNLKDNL
ncbi:MAG: prepilin-type N-terminal cleavage/methylation domain-containing protein [Patescibacteria group bacterium]|jgi:type II secretory pathway pseudopilin PulG